MEDDGRAGTWVAHSLVSPHRQRPGHAVTLGGGAPSAAPQPGAEGHVLTPLLGGTLLTSGGERRLRSISPASLARPESAGFSSVLPRRHRRASPPAPQGERRVAGPCRDEGAIPTHGPRKDPGGGGFFFFFASPRERNIFLLGHLAELSTGGSPGGGLSPGCLSLSVVFTVMFRVPPLSPGLSSWNWGGEEALHNPNSPNSP